MAGEGAATLVDDRARDEEGDAGVFVVGKDLVNSKQCGLGKLEKWRKSGKKWRKREEKVKKNDEK